jgi:hypothetical protein
MEKRIRAKWELLHVRRKGMEAMRRMTESTEFARKERDGMVQ